MARPDSYRLYGSIRILRDGRVRFSPRMFPVPDRLDFLLTTDLINVDMSARTVLFLFLTRGRMQSACFSYLVTPDELRAAVAALRCARNGLERWIVPGLEWMSLGHILEEDHPATYAALPEILESCEDLPIAEQWRRVREQAFANDERVRAKRKRAEMRAAKRAAEKGLPAPKALQGRRAQARPMGQRDAPKHGPGSCLGPGEEGTKTAKRALYGSIRVSREGRVRFSSWTFPAQPYINFVAMSGGRVLVELTGRPVMDLELSRGRLVSARFRPNLTPKTLSTAVSVLRKAGGGLERWLVPALELTSRSTVFRRDNPEAYAIVPELLESCRDLPIADKWKRVRVRHFASGR